MAKAGARLGLTHYLLLLVARAGQGAEVARPLLERDRRQLARLSLIRVRLEKRRYGDHFSFHMHLLHCTLSLYCNICIFNCKNLVCVTLCVHCQVVWL